MANSFEGPILAAAVGSTGNNTHSSVHVGADNRNVVLQFVVEAVGATPTVTYKWQGSADGTNWYDLLYITDASDTAAATTRTATTVSAQVSFPSLAHSRRYKYYRLVTSANTNVTYRGEIYLAD